MKKEPYIVEGTFSAVVYAESEEDAKASFDPLDIDDYRKDVSSTNIENTGFISIREALDAVEESRRLNHHKDAKKACAHEYEHRHFLKILMDIQPADVAPVVHGEWLPIVSYDNIYKCSECGRLLKTINGKNMVAKHYPYCHCGAKNGQRFLQSRKEEGVKKCQDSLQLPSGGYWAKSRY